MSIEVQNISKITETKKRWTTLVFCKKGEIVGF